MEFTAPTECLTKDSFVNRLKLRYWHHIDRIPIFFLLGSNGLYVLIKGNFVLFFLVNVYLSVVSYVSIAKSPAHPPPQTIITYYCYGISNDLCKVFFLMFIVCSLSFIVILFAPSILF